MGKQWGFSKRTEYGGRLYASKMEAAYAAKLDLLMKAKGVEAVKWWNPQVRVPLVVNGQKICSYIVDFEVCYGDFQREYVEIKGHETAIWRLKVKLLKACYPGCVLRVVKKGAK